MYTQMHAHTTISYINGLVNLPTSGLGKHDVPDQPEHTLVYYTNICNRKYVCILKQDYSKGYTFDTSFEWSDSEKTAQSVNLS